MRRRSGFGWMEFIEGVLLLGLGSYTFAQPDRALTGFIVMYGIVAVTMGIADILLYVRVERFTGFGPIVSLISGALSVMTGVMLLVYPNAGKWVMEKRTLEKGSIWMIVIIFAMSLWLCLQLEYIGHRRFPLFMERIVYIPLTVTALLLECKLIAVMPKNINRVLTMLGTISLEIYLIHIQFVMLPLQQYKLGYCVTALLVIVISTPVAYLLHWIIEKVMGCRVFRILR